MRFDRISLIFIAKNTFLGVEISIIWNSSRAKIFNVISVIFVKFDQNFLNSFRVSIDFKFFISCLFKIFQQCKRRLLKIHDE